MTEAPVARQGREAVMHVLRQAAEPMSVADIADAVGLHVNTVRGHLDLLVHLGAVSRQTEHTGGRGRPKVLYQLSPEENSQQDAYRTLAAALANELSILGGTDQATADEAGRLWAEALLQEGRLSPTSSPDEALSQVTSLFNELGFAASTEPLGDRVYLTSCPYAVMRDAFPTVCDIHLGLMRGAFSVTSSDIEVDDFDIDARPGLCVARLSRPTRSDPKETR